MDILLFQSYLRNIVDMFGNFYEIFHFSEFSSTVSPDHECVIYVMEPDFRFFWRFLEGFFLKVLH